MCVTSIIPNLPPSVLSAGPWEKGQPSLDQLSLLLRSCFKFFSLTITDHRTVCCVCERCRMGVNSTASTGVVIRGGTAGEISGRLLRRVDRRNNYRCAVDINCLAIEIDRCPVNCRSSDRNGLRSWSWSCEGHGEENQGGKTEYFGRDHIRQHDLISVGFEGLIQMVLMLPMLLMRKEFN